MRRVAEFRKSFRETVLNRFYCVNLSFTVTADKILELYSKSQLWVGQKPGKNASVTSVF